MSALPNFLIIGAAKSGTTSLAHYLAQHPEIFVAERKEVDFFVDENFHRGLDWYRRQFSSAHAFNGDASPLYAARPRRRSLAAPERVRRTLPDAKLIYLVRDPIDRLVSDYTDHVCQVREPRDLETVVREVRPGDDYVAMGRYRFQLDPYLERFARDSILVLALEEMRADPAAVYRRTLRFLGLPDEVPAGLSFARRNDRSSNRRPNAVGRWVARREPVSRVVRDRRFPLRRTVHSALTKGGATFRELKLSDAAEERLRGLFRDDVRRLQDLLGRDLPGWRAY